ncbi:MULTISPECIES: hypothetical protein [Pseudomonas]|uniref:hypothetical protein n=1 Tax=Pseudomonas nitroreducens TaxID=46680 RepID=UPI001E41020B|nr:MULTISPECIES: hypothetical protein [Pseudomonas]MCE4072314.1 hypothetical protein [Pseudomonas nitritireducens]MCE4081820.1 hypothetical protein [Pseudomonas nitroreducens]
MEDIQACSIKEVLRRSTDDLVVADGQTIEFTPSNREFAQHFARVRLAAFEDLQLLGFVPRGLSEEAVRKAMASDDDHAYRLATSSITTSGHDCTCSPRHGAITDRLVTAHRQARRSNNPALARLLSDHFQVDIAFHDPLPVLTRNWVSYFDTKRHFGADLVISLLADVTIHRNAVLATDSKLKSLLARNIWIHRTGQLVQRGSYMRIWAHSISRFQDFKDIVTTLHIDAPWRAPL